MNLRKKPSIKEKNSRHPSDSEVPKHIGKSSKKKRSIYSLAVTPDPPAELMWKCHTGSRSSKVLNLQVRTAPLKHWNFKRPLQTAKARPLVETPSEENPVDMTRTLRDKTSMLAKVTALQQRGNTLKKTKRTPGLNLDKSHFLERQISKEQLKNNQLCEGTLQESMDAFREALSHFLTTYA